MITLSIFLNPPSLHNILNYNTTEKQLILHLHCSILVDSALQVNYSRFDEAMEQSREDDSLQEMLDQGTSPILATPLVQESPVLMQLSPMQCSYMEPSIQLSPMQSYYREPSI